jgi:hypothetical protein
MHRLFLALLSCVLLFQLSGCTADPHARDEVPAQAGEAVAATAPPKGGAWTRTELVFGLKKADGSVVSSKEWSAFLAEVMTPRFPDGLTVLEGYGQYRTASGQLVSEPSNTVMILRPPGGGAGDAAIEAIRAEYCKRFGQESVLKITTPAAVSF